MKIVLSAALTLLLLGCSDSKESSHAKNEMNKQIKETADVVSKSTDQIVAKTKEATKVIVAQAQEVTKETVEEVKKKTAKAVESVAHETAKVAKNVEEKAKVATASAIDGSKLFRACAGCHGAHAERKALGKSQVIKGWAATKVETALHGYKAGTYGGSMKTVMKGQASKLSDADISAIAAFVSKQ